MVYGVLAWPRESWTLCFMRAWSAIRASADDGACQWYSERDVRLHAAGLSLCRAVGHDLLFPLWFLTHCISNLTHLNWVRLTAGRVNYTISLVLNILGIMLATLMLLHPVLSAVSMS